MLGRKPLLLIVPWISVWGIACLLFTVTRVPTLWQLHRLKRQGMVTTATVVEVQPEHHNLVIYSYGVSSREYRGSEGRRMAKVGQTLPVYYLPSDPQVARLGSPTIDETFNEEASSTAVVGLVFPTVMVWAVWGARRQWRLARRRERLQAQ